MNKAKYSKEQHEALMSIYEKYRKKTYLDLSKLADKRFNDTKHSRDDVQIGVDVFYDDKKLGHIRCSVALYIVEPNAKWWKFWDAAVQNEDFIMKPDGSFIGE